MHCVALLYIGNGLQTRWDNNGHIYYHDMFALYSNNSIHLCNDFLLIISRYDFFFNVRVFNYKF